MDNLLMKMKCYIIFYMKNIIQRIIKCRSDKFSTDFPIKKTAFRRVF